MEQKQLDDDKLAITSANQALEIAKSKLEADTQQFKSEHPAVGILEEMETKLSEAGETISDEFKSVFGGLLSKVKHLVSGTKVEASVTATTETQVGATAAPAPVEQPAVEVLATETLANTRPEAP